MKRVEIEYLENLTQYRPHLTTEDMIVNMAYTFFPFWRRVQLGLRIMFDR